MAFAVKDDKNPNSLSSRSCFELHDARVAHAKAKQRMLLDMLRKHYGIYHEDKQSKSPSIVSILTS
jgi:hypothetical protein